MIAERPRTMRMLKKEFFNSVNPYGLRLIPTGKVDTILDIGANIGMFSVYARFLQPKARILSFEPHLSTFKCLEENTRNLDIELVNAGLGSNGKIHFTEDARSSISVVYSEVENPANGVTVDAYTIPEIMSKYEVNRTNLVVKIDCEGAERHIKNESSMSVLKSAMLVGIETHQDPEQWIAWVQDTFRVTHVMSMDRHKHGNLLTATLIRKDIIL